MLRRVMKSMLGGNRGLTRFKKGGKSLNSMGLAVVNRLSK